ncbi:hypothetical protein RhiXN_05482 [Rhizoctonia solani]|uniref:Uncharacterized protein n=1 Tax=Rhizoctonia solani TaxID=456999 RepID=A0A8H8NQJ1_9AGAM|nr:uncharacterized protein RhiXN_05482 [Rhizoctonia solani]QRW17480.1 hypothetical protein RhiXN_05482 [Rhizoctonia solani]
MSTKTTLTVFTSASSICKIPERFNTWLGEVQVDPNVRRTLPDQITDMVDESLHLPAWLFDPNSHYYQTFESVYPGRLHRWNLRRPATNSEPQNESTSKDLVHALHHILYVQDRHAVLSGSECHKKIHSESDLRQPLDRLAAHVWCTEVGTRDGFCFRSECTVKLPNTNIVRIADSTVDSILFLFNPNPQNSGSFKVIPTPVRAGLTCTTDMVDTLELVHWVTEYKKSDLAAVQRQVYYGMVSSLWQRRALGRMEDFVFGAAHNEQDLMVYAARWEMIPVEQSGEIARDINHPDTPAEGPSNFATTQPRQRTSTDVSLRLQSKETSNSGLAGESLVKREYKALELLLFHIYSQIVVYEIATYQTVNLNHMIQFYLLMRASRHLARQYQEEILRTPFIDIKEMAEEQGLYNWFSPPRRKDTTKSHSGLGSIHEEPGPSGAQEAILVADPQDEAEWRAEWDLDRRRAIEICGDGSLKGLKDNTSGGTEADWNDRMSSYLSSLY